MTVAARPALSALPRADWSGGVRAVLDSADIDEVVVYRLPMNVRFRGITHREGVLLRGPAGWGECAPFWDYDAAESSRWLESGIESATSPWPAPTRSQVPVNVTVPALEPQAAVERVNSQPECATAKVKVAEHAGLSEADLARVTAVSAALADRHGDRARVRVDANAGWTVDQARQMLSRLNQAACAAGGLEYAEQPVDGADKLRELRALTDVPLAADESLRRAQRPLEVRDLQAADIAVVKAAPLGGVAAASRLADQLGLPAVVSSALDSSIGIAAGVALAASLPSLSYACGLNTATMFAADVLDHSLTAQDGALTIERAREVRAADLNRHASRVDTPTKDRWATRLAAMAAALSAETRGNR